MHSALNKHSSERIPLLGQHPTQGLSLGRAQGPTLSGASSMRESTTPATRGRILASSMVFSAARSLLLTTFCRLSSASSASVASLTCCSSCCPIPPLCSAVQAECAVNRIFNTRLLNHNDCLTLVLHFCGLQEHFLQQLGLSVLPYTMCTTLTVHDVSIMYLSA